MEKRGLVVREECSEDGRGLMVRLTDAGRTAIEYAAPKHAVTVRRYFFDLLSDEDLATLGAVFDRVLEFLQSAFEAGASLAGWDLADTARPVPSDWLANLSQPTVT